MLQPDYEYPRLQLTCYLVLDFLAITKEMIYVICALIILMITDCTFGGRASSLYSVVM